MELKDFFPMWDKLEAAQRRTLENAAGQRSVRKGEIIHSGDMECTGLYLVVSGQLRAYILSEEGREISIYRLFPRDICLFSASCIMRSIQFQVTIQAEKVQMPTRISHPAAPAQMPSDTLRQSVSMTDANRPVSATGCHFVCGSPRRKSSRNAKRNTNGN